MSIRPLSFALPSARSARSCWSSTSGQLGHQLEAHQLRADRTLGPGQRLLQRTPLRGVEVAGPRRALEEREQAASRLDPRGEPRVRRRAWPHGRGARLPAGRRARHRAGPPRDLDRPATAGSAPAPRPSCPAAHRAGRGPPRSRWRARGRARARSRGGSDPRPRRRARSGSGRRIRAPGPTSVARTSAVPSAAAAPSRSPWLSRSVPAARNCLTMAAREPALDRSVRTIEQLRLAAHDPG